MGAIIPVTTPPVALPRTTKMPKVPSQGLPKPHTNAGGPRPAIRKIDLYIPNCESSYTRDRLKAYINSSIGTTLYNSDIMELNTRNGSRAFKVSVPEDKKVEALSIWPAGIKAELYVKRKPGTVANNQSKGGNSGLRVNGNKFRGPNSYISK